MTNPIRGAVPVVDDSDVSAFLPLFVRSSDSAIVRDALVAAIRVILTTYQDAAAYAALQSDVLTATGAYLDSKLEPITKRQDGEDDDAYRARGLSFQAVVTPEAIIAAVNALISPYTATWMEPALDGMFLHDETASVWDSFIGSDPIYLDRYYPDDVTANSGYLRPSIDPGAGYVFTDLPGRVFVIRIPDLAGLDTSIQLIYDGTKLAVTDPAVPELGGATPPAGNTPAGSLDSSLGGLGIYLFDTGASDARQFLYSNTTDSLSTYETIVATVDRLKGSSFQWMLYVS